MKKTMTFRSSSTASTFVSSFTSSSTTLFHRSALFPSSFCTILKTPTTVPHFKLHSLHSSCLRMTAAMPQSTSTTTYSSTSSDIQRIPWSTSDSSTSLINNNDSSSAAVIHNNIVYISSITSTSGITFEDQTISILKIIDSILSSVNLDKSSLLTSSIILTSSSSYEKFLNIWKSWLSNSDKPVISCSYASSIPSSTNAQISISVTAAISSSSTSTITNGIINTERAALAVGPYSQAIVDHDGTVYISGCIGLNTGTNAGMAGETLEEQTTQALSNLKEILKEAKCQPKDIVKTTVLLADMNDFAKVNEMYAGFFEPGRVPARSCFAAKTLPKGALVEIEAIAKQPK